MKTTTHDNSNLLHVITLLSDLVVYEHYDFNEFLKKLIAVITNIVPVDACLIYFYDHEKKEYILIGSKKPHEKEIGNITLEKGEGITGWVAEHKQTVALAKNAYKDPRFKFFKELPEDRYEAFLSVPIVDRTGTVGVINLQNIKPYQFTKEQIHTVESLVKLIASAFVKVVLERKVGHLESKLEERKIIEKAKGILMKAKGMSEDAAYQLLKKEAMKNRKPLKDIAQAILLVGDKLLY